MMQKSLCTGIILCIIIKSVLKGAEWLHSVTSSTKFLKKINSGAREDEKINLDTLSDRVQHPLEDKSMVVQYLYCCSARALNNVVVSKYATQEKF